MSIKKEVLGSTQDGKEASLFRMTNRNGYEALISDLGAVWAGFRMPDRSGRVEDVVLGYDDLGGLTALAGEMGAIVGRNANRIKDAAFRLNGVSYRLAANSGPNNLHSGPDKFSKRVYRAEPESLAHADALHLFLESPDGDQGYPGSLSVEVVYSLTDENAFRIEYKLCAGDQDTIANFTCHPYFNLAGHKSGSALSQLVWIDADSFCEADENTCTTGRLLSVEGTPFDFRTPKALGRDIKADVPQLRYCHGYDHNFCLNHEKGKMALAASAYDEKSGRKLEVYTERPGIQLYTGNFLNPNVTAKEGAHYHPYDGYAFETQFYPNAINVPQWEQPVIRAGETNRAETIYQFSVAK